MSEEAVTLFLQNQLATEQITHEMKEPNSQTPCLAKQLGNNSDKLIVEAPKAAARYK
jgi:hypothetical protein